MAEETTALAELASLAKDGDLRALQQLRDRGFFERRPAAPGDPVTHAQKRLWLLDRIEPGLAVYSMPAAVTLEGTLEPGRFRRAFDAVVRAHESLRTTFELVGDELRAIVHELGPELRTSDVRADSDPAAHAAAMLRADANVPFDLARGPLVRALLLRTGDERWVFSCNVHHAVCDGWSQDIVLRDLLRAYETDAALVPPPVRYGDYASAQQAALRGPGAAAARAYWLQALSGEIEPLRLPTDFPRPPELTHAGANHAFEIGAETVAALDRFARSARATPFQLLTALVKVLLHRYTGQEDVVVGTAVAGRDEPGVADVVGVFVNTLVLRDRIAGSDSFADVIARVKATAEAAHEHGAYPFDLVVADLDVRPDLARSPLFDVAVVFQDDFGARARAGGLTATPFDSGFATAKFDLTFYVGPARNGGVRIVLNYNTALFRAETVARMAGHLGQLAQSVAANPAARVDELEIITSAERRQLVDTFNDTAARYPDATIGELFEAQVAAHPDDVAVVAPAATWTYRELNARANRIAWALRTRYGVRAGDLVAVLLQPSEWSVAALLGVLKAGAAYVPLDPIYPPERRAFMLRDAGARVLVAADDGGDHAGAVAVANVYALDGLDVNPPPSARPGDLAYVIYTSGSTSVPKGCCVEHRSVVRLLCNDRLPFAFGRDDTWIVAHSLCFDFSVWEMYGALLHGGRLVVPDRESVRDVETFHALVREHRVTVLNQTPAAFYGFVASESTAGRHDLADHLRYVIFGGDRLEPAQLREWLAWYPIERIALVNMYGITETTVHVTFGALRERDVLDASGASPIGVPLPDTSVYVLDAAQRLQPVGVTGELYVGGGGVCRAYLGRPELTAQRFLDDPFRPGRRMYRTGDLGRWLPDGTLEHLGRNDAQVQVRGFRVELAELQARLRAHPQVRAAVAIARETPDRVNELIAYVVPANVLDADDVRRHLRETLPEYMVPAHVVELAALPLTTNGKLDHAALPAPGAARVAPATAVAPRDGFESALAAIWSRVLGIAVTSVDENYFNLGGDSIKVIRLVNAIAAELGVRIAVKDVFRHPTIAQLAHDVRRGGDAGESRALAAERLDERRRELRDTPALRALPADAYDDWYPLSEIQKGMIFHHLLDSGYGIYHDQFVYEWRDETFDANVLRDALRLIVEKHSILRTSFHVEQEPVQIVHRGVPVDFTLDDRSALDRAAQEAYLRRLLDEDLRRPFDVARPGLWRFGVVQLGPGHLAMIWIFHHAILDGWSNASFLAELFGTYFRLKREPGYRPQPLRATYADFVADQLRVEASAETAAFWRTYLAGYEKTPLPLGKVMAAPAQRSRRNKFVTRIDGRVSDALLARARAENVPVREIYLAAFHYWLGLIAGRPDPLFGLVGHNRPSVEDGERIVGCFLNSIPFRHAIRGDETPCELIRLVHARLEESRPHEKLAMRTIAELVGAASNEGNQLFEVLFNFIDFHVLEQLDATFSDGAGIMLNYSSTNTPFDCSVNGTFGVYRLSIAYLADLFEQSEIERVAGYFVRVLERFADAASEPLRTTAVLGAETALLLETLSGPLTAYPRDASVAALFEEQVRRDPAAAAVESGGRRLTYAELNALANGVAFVLRETYGLAPEERVAIRLQRSEWTVVAMLAVLKAGGAYVPLDPDFPAPRVALIVEDTGCRWVLTDASVAPLQLDGVRELDVAALAAPAEPDLELPVDGSRLAYVIYTSGSTGTPKGSLIEQRAIVRLVRDTNYVRIGPADRIVQAGSIAFDACTFEVWGALLNGACVVVLEGRTLTDQPRFARALRDARISVLFLTTSLFNQLAEDEPAMFDGVRVLLTGGEKASPEHFERVREACPALELLHVYGPTENTTFTTFHRITRRYDDDVPIGAPIANGTAYVLDRALRLLPLGVPGEICTGGDGVARGYLGDAALTERAFAPDPFRAGGRLYRTGDRARVLPDGAIRFLGRIDDQLKVRGFRVEPGEIEVVLRRHPAIADAVVVANRTAVGTMELAGYYTSRAPFEPAEVRAYLGDTLPRYMVPAHLVRLDALPLSSTGKVDRRALPAPGDGDVARDDEAEPRDERERLLAGLWCELLGRPRVGIRDDYFELGGDSIKSIQMSSRLRRAGWTLELRDLFEFPEIARLAPRLRRAGAARERVRTAGPAPLTPVQRWFFEEHGGDLGHFAMSVLLQSRERIDEASLRAALGALWDRHAALRSTFARDADAIEQTPDAQGPFAFDVVYDDAALAALKGRFDLRAGPLMHAALVRADDGDRVFLAFHHLVVDALSLRILIEDLERAYGGGELADESDSFADWSRHLLRWAQSEACAREADYWAGVLRAPAPDLRLDHPDGSNRYGDCRSVDVAFDEEETSAVMTGLPAGFDVSAVLLTALGRALRAFHGHDATTLLLEGHGREPLEDGVEVDRTTGWFTTMFPFRVELRGDGAAAQLRHVSASLRDVPRKGIGFGVARYLAPPAVQAPLRGALPAIGFNYLGEFVPGGAALRFELLGAGPGAPAAPEIVRRNVLDVVGAVLRKSLQVSFTYSARRFERATIERLADAFRAELLAVAAQAHGLGTAPLPRARFAGVSDDELAGALSELQ